MSHFNKPKYSLINNGKYALDGLWEIYKNESSIKIHLLALIAFTIFIYFLPIGIGYKLYMFFSMFIPIMAEIINSAIERVVDLVTGEYHIMAKRAKDAGSALVFVSLIFTFFTWVAVLLLAFEIIA